MDIELRTAKQSEKDIVFNLMQEYLSELAAFTTIETDENGQYRFPYLEFYWGDPSRFPFLVRLRGRKIAGFALLRAEIDGIRGQQMMEVAEFFIQREYRNQGVGNAMAVKLWDQFPGQWTVRVLKANKPAYVFWKHAIHRYTEGNYHETADNVLNSGNFTFEFENPFDMEPPSDIEPGLLDY